ncbi:hypothetical protein MHH81_11165 [Psychrobacillus sp. FSL H8-0484]|uniref:hypothetical protein n=1 Tax=Psychrobacillus sp. FSL H8-0484 TaxID=2921390 RepID=UPI0030FA43F1
MVDCDFLGSNEIPSEVSYTRMNTLINESDVIEIVQEGLLRQTISEGFVSNETIAIEATHVESHNRAPINTNKVKKGHQKRGVKSKKNLSSGNLYRLSKKRIFHSIKNNFRLPGCTTQPLREAKLNSRGNNFF